MIVNVGEAHIVVNISRDNPEEFDHSQSPNADMMKLKLKIFGGP